jgi:ribonuclease P protein component
LRRTDFLRVQRDGRRVHTEHFVVMVLPGPRQRLGVTVTRRTASAVGRNRVKRLVREVFRRRRELFPTGCELVLVARAGSQGLDYAALERELAEASPALLRAAQAKPPPSPKTPS